MVERSHIFDLRRALKDHSASQERVGGIKSRLSIESRYVHLTFGYNSRNTFKCPKFVQLHLFITKYWGTKDIVSLMSKRWRYMAPCSTVNWSLLKTILIL